MKPYKEIFSKVEAILRRQSKLSKEEFDSHFGGFKNYEQRNLSNGAYFDILVKCIFYSGFKSETVDEKMEKIETYFPPDFDVVAAYDDKRIADIMNDSDMIKNERKIKACVNNAKQFKTIINEHGSFKNYVDSFKPNDSFENLMLFKEELEYKFGFLGPITVYHFMTDIGLPVLKPDRVITRIFKRIGLIESTKQLLKTVIHGRKFSDATGYPIRYIDIIFVKYGQKGKDDFFGLDDGICLEKNPKCYVCGIKGYCGYFKKTPQSALL